MKSTQQTTKINGLIFSRWHNTGRMTLSERRTWPSATVDSFNAASPWTLEIMTEEINGQLERTGETCGIVVKVWPTQEAIKTEGADRMTDEAATKLGAALTAAAQLIKEFKNETRCPNHGAIGDEMPFACEGCFLEMEAELDEQERRTRIAANAFSR